MHSNSKERGMIFNAEMVRAILSGQKTQTRRIMKVQPVLKGSFYEVYGAGWGKGVKSVPVVHGHSLSNNCPLGIVGDRIWVRETWQCVSYSLGEHGYVEDVDYKKSIPKTKPVEPRWGVTYEASELEPKDREERGFPWVPSIHMPRWASRILLEITNVRVERLNDISEGDAIAEGIERYNDDGIVYYGPYGKGDCRPERAFSDLWKSIYGDESWEKNPWVWCISFKRVQEQSND